jgi:hypothetical protein
MAASILRPIVVDFLELRCPDTARTWRSRRCVARQSGLVGRTIAQIEEASARLRVVGLRRGDEDMRVVPRRRRRSRRTICSSSSARARASAASRPTPPVDPSPRRQPRVDARTRAS